MCIIVAKPAGAAIDIETLRNCWDENPHGAGIAYAMNGKLVIEKGFMKWEVFKEFIIDTEQWTDIPMLIHFRVATVGNKDQDNTHPFEVIPGKLAFAHNGTIKGMAVKEKPELSDTNIFCRYVLKQLPHNFLSNTGIVTLMYSSLGDWGKLAFLDNEGEITIFNEAGGHEKADVWYSNDDYLGRWGHYYKGYSYPLPTVRTLEQESEVAYLDEWYCYDCCLWFNEDEAQTNPVPGDDDCVPVCPYCGTVDGVQYDPLNEFEELSTTNPLDDERDAILAAYTAASQ